MARLLQEACREGGGCRVERASRLRKGKEVKEIVGYLYCARRTLESEDGSVSKSEYALIPVPPTEVYMKTGKAVTEELGWPNSQKEDLKKNLRRCRVRI